MPPLLVILSAAATPRYRGTRGVSKRLWRLPGATTSARQPGANRNGSTPATHLRGGTGLPQQSELQGNPRNDAVSRRRISFNTGKMTISCRPEVCVREKGTAVYDTAPCRVVSDGHRSLAGACRASQGGRRAVFRGREDNPHLLSALVPVAPSLAKKRALLRVRPNCRCGPGFVPACVAARWAKTRAAAWPTCW